MKAETTREQELPREKAGPDWRSLEKANSHMIPEAMGTLLKKEEGYRFLVENMREGLIMMDENAMITFANQRFCEIVGYTREEVLGWPQINAFKTLTGPSGGTLKEQMEKRRKGAQDPYEIEWTRPDGKKVFVTVAPKAIFDSEGSFRGAFGIITDITRLKNDEITSRKRAQEKLLREREQVREIFDTINQMIYIVDPVTHQILYANKALRDAFKRPLIGGVCYEELQGLSSPCDFCTNEVLFKNPDQPYQWEYHNPLLDRDFFIIDRLIKWGEGRDARLEIAIDITERKKAEAELANSEAKLSAILSASPLGIGLMEKRIMQWHNKTMADMLGYNPEELTGKDARMIYPNDEEYKKAGKAIASLDEKKATPIIDTRWVRKDGSSFPCRLCYASLRDPLSGKQEILEIAEDMTERSRLEAQLQQSQKMEAIGTLAGGVAHDFNNLLTAIIGNADIALMDLNKDDPSYEKFEEIIKAGKRAASLTRQLLGFSRKQVIQPEVVNLNMRLRETEKMLRRLIGEDILFHTSLEENLWDIYADPGQMEQVLMNLVVNARDAMPKGGDLAVETVNAELDAGYFSKYGIDNPPGPYVMLAVTDNGVGMDEATRSNIFDPFFTTKEKGKGTGLGLSTVYGIVKQNNGYIWVYSEKGKGTSFKVYLPKAKEGAIEVKEKRTGEGSLEGSETILLVEDEDMVRDMAESFLEKYGYSVFKAANPEEAIRISEEYQERIHLLLTDVVMPRMGGMDLAEQIKSQRPNIKVVYMSGYTNSTFSHHNVLDKELEFIEKPFSLAQLAHKIRNMLDDADLYQEQG